MSNDETAHGSNGTTAELAGDKHAAWFAETMSALAEATSFADVRSIRNVAAVIAKAAKDDDLRAGARKIRTRATRLLQQQLHRDRCIPSQVRSADFQPLKAIYFYKLWQSPMLRPRRN